MSHPTHNTPTLDTLVQRAEDFARREPTKAVMSAFGAGIALNLLPLTTIASALTGIAFSMVRPTLLFLGVRKACDLCLTQQPISNRHE